MVMSSISWKIGGKHAKSKTEGEHIFAYTFTVSYFKFISHRSCFLQAITQFNVQDLQPKKRKNIDDIMEKKLSE